MALAREAKVPVPDEALEAIAGGDDPDPENCKRSKCPSCGSKNITITDEQAFGYCIIYSLKCNDCGNTWTVNQWM